MFLESMALVASGGDTTPYQANAVEFDGTNDYLSLTGNLTGTVDGKEGTFYCFFNVQGDSGSFREIYVGGTRFIIRRDNTNKILIQGRNASNTNVVLMTSAANYTDSSWHSLVASWDLAATTGHLYIDDVDGDNGTPTLTDSNIDYTFENTNIGSQGTTFKWDGFLSDVFFHDSYLDISDTANRRKFITDANKPVDLGADGSTPLGVQPLLFCSGDTSTWHTNLGTGGGFIENGELTTAPSSPSD